MYVFTFCFYRVKFLKILISKYYKIQQKYEYMFLSLFSKILSFSGRQKSFLGKLNGTSPCMYQYTRYGFGLAVILGLGSFLFVIQSSSKNKSKFTKTPTWMKYFLSDVLSRAHGQKYKTVLNSPTPIYVFMLF